MKRRKRILIAVLGLAGLTAMPAVAEVAPPDESLQAIRSEISQLRQEYDRRLAALESRLTALESGAGPTAAPQDELARLRQAARRAAGVTAATSAPATSTTPAVGRERNLNKLNPEISFTGIVVASASDRAREEFAAQEFELDLQTNLDPFSRTRWTIAFGDEGVEVEEGYLQFNRLKNTELFVGKFRQSFGPLNRQHLHALPQTDYPLVYQTLFGEEGLAQTGISLAWLPEKSPASATEIVLQVTDGENEVAFGGEEFENLAFLARLKNFWDIGDATYFEWGLSGIGGETSGGGDSRVYGTDFTYHWQPPQRAKYREVTWRTELLLSQRDDALGVEREALGLYSYLEGLFKRNLYGGVRFDRVEDPLDPNRTMRGISPYLTWWQSEYVRLRAQYSYLEDESTNEDENRFALQFTWAAGPHKHESY